jgi:hypothetical protein
MKVVARWFANERRHGPGRRLYDAGLVDLGTTGALKVRPLLGAGHRVLVHDVNPAAVPAAVLPREYPPEERLSAR